MSVKGQMFSFDFLLASSIFLLTVGMLFTYWAYTNIQIEETREINEMIYKAYTASEVWFREGMPKYWNSTNVIELGMQNDHRINQTKIDRMKMELGYEKTKTMVGLGGYDYNFSIYNNTKHLIWSAGQPVSTSAQDVINVKRISILNGSIVTLHVTVWI